MSKIRGCCYLKESNLVLTCDNMGGLYASKTSKANVKLDQNIK